MFIPQDWYGLSKAGNQRKLTATQMSDWAFDNEMQFSIGWSNHVMMPDGTRMVRGKTVADAVEAARSQGWNDLADMLARAFGD